MLTAWNFLKWKLTCRAFIDLRKLNDCWVGTREYPILWILLLHRYFKKTFFSVLVQISDNSKMINSDTVARKKVAKPIPSKAQMMSLGTKHLIPTQRREKGLVKWKNVQAKIEGKTWDPRRNKNKKFFWPCQFVFVNFVWLRMYIGYYIIDCIASKVTICDFTHRCWNIVKVFVQVIDQCVQNQAL